MPIVRDSRLSRLSRVAGAFALVAGATTALAHENDPKGLDLEPAYEGSGWRAADGGVAGNDFEAEGIALGSWLTLSDLDASGGSNSGNDCWGYASPSGREYAIIGTSNGTAFVEVTNPAAATLVAFRDGPNSLWRDVKTFSTYAYSVSEGGGGIQVFDLSNIDSGAVTLVNTIDDVGASSSHNVAIDEASGFLYRCGGGNNVGLRMYDLNGDPSTPQYVGAWLDRYVHDAQIVTYDSGPYAGRQIAFCCAGFNNGGTDTALDIVDVTDKSNPVVLSQTPYPNRAYSHQGWLTTDRNYFLLGDELDEGGSVATSTLYVFDVSDLENPQYRVAFENGNPAITHNLYTVGDLVYAANYRSGLRIFDATNPLAMEEVAFFDTYPGSDGASFDGLWSVYPYLPSGTIIGSDLQRGLFVMSADLSFLTIELEGSAPELVASSGEEVRVRISEFDADLVEDSVRVVVTESDGTQSIVAASVDSSSLGDVFVATLPALPCLDVVDVAARAESLAGEFFEQALFTALVADEELITVDDDFEVASGWIVGAPDDDAGTGIWERVVPRGTAAAPGSDRTPDGSFCFVTGQGSAGGGLGENDVDGGTTTLTSPAFDLSASVEPVLSYWRWYSNDTGAAPNTDTMPIEISNDDGKSWVLLEDVTESNPEWIQANFRVADFVEPTSTVRVRFRARDLGDGSVVEAGVDDVRISEFDCIDESVPGDVNGDGTVNGTDLGVLLGVWGSSDEASDLNGDGTVDGADLAVVLANWS